MFEPPPNGMTTASASIAARRTAATASSSPGRTTTSGEPPELAAPVPHEVAQALAAGVDEAVEGIGRDVLGADGGLQGGAELGRHAGLGDAQIAEGDPR